MSIRISIAVLLAGALFAMMASAGSAEEKKPPTTTASAPAGDLKSFTGQVETTRARKQPRLAVGDTHYELFAAEKAEAGVKDVLKAISEGTATGEYTVKGTVKAGAERPTIMVVSIDKGDAKK